MERDDLDALVVAPSVPFREIFPYKFDSEADVSKVYDGESFLLDSGFFVVGAWCYIFKRQFWHNNNFEFYPGISIPGYSTYSMGNCSLHANCRVEPV